MHKFFHFAHLKSTFSILHTYFYKTPTSVCLFYTFIQIKYSFLYPHSHRPTATDPHRYHIGIHTTHRQKTRKKNQQQDRHTRNQHNPATQSTQSNNSESKQTQQHNPHNPSIENQKNKPSNKIDAPGINTTQQHNPATRNRNKPSNTIHTTHPKLTPRLEQQDRCLWWRWRERETRSTPPKASYCPVAMTW